ncbi:MAG: hypothetical protein JWN48_3215 [Myxococcaceae bacterium]|nr:hypothetical protein [Myxococcaceae bacterium]
MRRRLPLLGAPTVAAPLHDMLLSRAASHERAQLGPHSIGLADTGDGGAAADFAVELAAAISALDVRVTIVLLGFEGTPVLPAQLSRRLESAGVPLSSHAVAVSHPVLPDALPNALGVTRAARLWVGLPAVSAFAPELSVLLGADRPLSGWPPALRPLRGRFQLELAQGRPGLAASLASSLNDHGLLPRG